MKQGLPKVFLAVGMESLENYLKTQLKQEFEFVGEAIYREAVVNNALQCNPDIILLRETLNGSKHILDIVYELRIQLPDSRIIFLASDRKPGDALLAELVGNGVYDILTGTRLYIQDLIRLFREPNKFSDVAIYRPKATIDKNTNEVLFEAPPIREVVKPIPKTIYVEAEQPNPKDPVQESNLPKNEGKKGKKPRRRLMRGDEPKGDSTIVLPQPKESSPEEVSVMKKDEEPSVLPDEATSLDRQVLPSEKNHPIHPTSEEVPPLVQPIPENKESESVEKPEISRPSNHPIPVHQPLTATAPLMIPKKKGYLFPISQKQKILTFVGGEHGVGNSQIAHNTAFTLAERGYKTIFIELKEEGSTIEYLYQLALADKGLDFALRSLQHENFAELEDSIIRIEELRRQPNNSFLEASYKTLSTNLDYLFFSADYILEKDESKKQIDPMLLKELCMHLLFQMGYQYIVLDAEPNLFNPYTEVAVGFGTHIFFTITQDVCHIGRAVRNISEIQKRINITPKLYYILNKFDGRIALSKENIQEWLQADIEGVIPLLYKDFMDANLNGIPVLTTSKDKSLKKAFDDLVNHILQK